jgi:glucan phosphoethanolaminetransferase (alkaline phosphatase superfamily)
MPEVQTWILEQLARYFIIIVSGFLLFIALNGDVVGYKIIYMLFFLFSGIIFQLSWNLWHRILRVFWLLLVVYSILVVVLIYTFQLKGFKTYWRNITELNDEQLKVIIFFEKFFSKNFSGNIFFLSSKQRKRYQRKNFEKASG